MGNLSQRTNDWFFEQIDFLTKMNVLTKRNIHYHWITRTLITSKTSKFTQLSVQPRACARPRGLPRRSFGLCGWTWTPLKEFDKPSICTHTHTHTSPVKPAHFPHQSRPHDTLRLLKRIAAKLKCHRTWVRHKFTPSCTADSRCLSCPIKSRGYTPMFQVFLQPVVFK